MCFPFLELIPRRYVPCAANAEAAMNVILSSITKIKEEVKVLELLIQKKVQSIFFLVII